MMDIRVFNLLEGARKAEGITVIIDVFRAFTVECFLAEMGVKTIIPMGDPAECLKLKKDNPDYFLIGERKGIKLDGFDLGNSPSQLTTGPSLAGRTVVHSTSAGTQGIILATGASEILTGSFVNASAVARYIRNKNPEVVTIVGMGQNGTEPSPEDVLCAEYIKALILGENPNIHSKLAELKTYPSGKKFFTRQDLASFPEPDFFMCLVPNIFDFVLKTDTSSYPFRMERIDVPVI